MQSGSLDLTGMHWLVVFGDINNLLHENQNTIIVDPTGDVCVCKKCRIFIV